jgi:hypothetical protein
VTEQQSRTIPDFVIAGAPRCATTFMWRYLRQHPQIYMPRDKEPTHFATDLDSGSYGDSLVFTRDSDYRALFADARPDQLTGEASTWYLYSKVAAERIKAANPGARILVNLRDPVEMVYSIHERRVFTGSEDLVDFREALAAEEDRRAGRRIPSGARIVKALFYRDVGRLGEQLERYLQQFGREAVHVTILDDLRADPEGAYQDVLRFLGVTLDFEAELDVANPAARRRSVGLHRTLKGIAAVPVVRQLLPQRFRTSLRRRLNAMNRTAITRPPLDPAVVRDLREEFRPDVIKLGEFLGRDFVSLWWSPRGE